MNRPSLEPLRLRRGVVLGLAGLLFAVAAPDPVAGQGPGEPLFARMSTGIGWSGVVPDALLGAAGFQMLGGSGWGLYTSANLTHDRWSGRSGFEPDATISSTEAQNVDIGSEREEWLFFTLGTVRELTPQFAIIGAVGPARNRVVREYYHRDDQRLVYVEDANESMGWGLSGMSGILLRISEPLLVQAGFEWSARSITLGGFWVVR